MGCSSYLGLIHLLNATFLSLGNVFLAEHVCWALEMLMPWQIMRVSSKSCVELAWQELIKHKWREGGWEKPFSWPFTCSKGQNRSFWSFILLLIKVKPLLELNLSG